MTKGTRKWSKNNSADGTDLMYIQSAVSNIKNKRNSDTIGDGLTHNTIAGNLKKHIDDLNGPDPGRGIEYSLLSHQQKSTVDLNLIEESKQKQGREYMIKHMQRDAVNRTGNLINSHGERIGVNGWMDSPQQKASMFNQDGERIMNQPISNLQSEGNSPSMSTRPGRSRVESSHKYANVLSTAQKRKLEAEERRRQEHERGLAPGTLDLGSPKPGLRSKKDYEREILIARGYQKVVEKKLGNSNY